VRSRGLRALALLAAGWLATAALEPGADLEQVRRVVMLSKETQATYALYAWNRIRQPGQPLIEEWSAEFHKGNLHRVETPRDRLIADCKAMTGTYFSLVSGKKTSGPAVAGAACGINSNSDVLEAAYLGRMDSRFGPVERVRLVDAENLRTYDVTGDGAIIGSTYDARDKEATSGLVMNAVAVEHRLPKPDLFSDASLATSAVPGRYKVAPRAGR